MVFAHYWSPWIDLAPGNDLCIPGHVAYGVYRNRLVDGDNSPIPIRRRKGIDSEGIVYIGAAGVRGLSTPAAMRGRFQRHQRAHASGRSGNGKDKRLVRLWQKILSEFPEARMQFQL